MWPITRIAAGVLLSLVLAGHASNMTTDGNDPIVDLGYAKYRGNTTFRNDFATDVFYGIHYAQSPEGNLRWMPPVDVEATQMMDLTQVSDARAPAPFCVQGNPAWALAPAKADISATNVTMPQGQEDCLTLDVYVPTHPVSDSLPVWVDIHGGGYIQGNSYGNPGYAVTNASNGNIVFVSIQYRLGVFGYLSGKSIKENGVANAGALDQRSALRWIQRNIEHFGGDPNKVTIMGGSAGGGAVMDQMILYGGEANPPFRSVISEYPWWQSFKNDTVLEAQYQQLLSLTNCSTLDCLRSLDTQALKLASQAVYQVAFLDPAGSWYGYGDFYFGPSVDGVNIKDLPSHEFEQGHFTKVALLVDHDGYEGYAFSNATESTLSDELLDLETLFPYGKQSFYDRLFQIYPASNFNSTFWQRQQIYGDYIINCPTYYMASATSDWGLPTYKLIFNAGSQVHGATLPYVFGTQYTNVDDQTLASIMKDWFLSFVTDLDPNKVSYLNVQKPNWPSYNPTKTTGTGGLEFAIMDVNKTAIGVIGDLDANAACDFMRSQSYVVRN